MIGWICAAVILVLALLVVWRQRVGAALWQRRCEEATMTLHQNQELMEQQRPAAELGRLLTDVGGALRPAQHEPAQPSEVLVGALVSYRQRVHDYDSAVQYCLQPVELIPGADEDDLERLMAHVNTARKRLFVTRAALVDDDMLQRLPELAGDQRQDGPEDLMVAALQSVSTAGQHDQPIELGELLSSVVNLTRARFAAGPALHSQIDELPVLPPLPWLATSLLRLLRLSLQQAAVDGEMTLHARNIDQQVELECSGERRARADEPADEATELGLEDLRRRLDERGVQLELLQDDPRRCGFVMRLPVADRVMQKA